MPLMSPALYRVLLRPILFSLDAETSHHLTLSMLSMMPPLPVSNDPSELRTAILGMEFSNPFGLAAGMDKDAIAIGAWQSLGFGFAETRNYHAAGAGGKSQATGFQIARASRAD